MVDMIFLDQLRIFLIKKILLNSHFLGWKKKKKKLAYLDDKSSK